MNEKQAITILMRNLKGSKNKPDNLILVSEAVRFLKKKLGLKELIRLFNISHTMINQIDKINDLNDFTKDLVKNGKLGIEQSYLLSKIEGKKQNEAAKEIVHLSAHDTRLFIDILRKDDKISVKSAAKKFSENTSKKIDLLVIPVHYNIYQKLEVLAKKRKITAHDLAYKVLEEYVIGQKL